MISRERLAFLYVIITTMSLYVPMVCTVQTLSLLSIHTYNVSFYFRFYDGNFEEILSDVCPSARARTNAAGKATFRWASRYEFAT